MGLLSPYLHPFGLGLSAFCVSAFPFVASSLCGFVSLSTFRIPHSAFGK